MKIDRVTNSVGLFGTIKNALIRNLKLEGLDITGSVSVGGLVGSGFNSLIENSHTSGMIQGDGDMGGVAGFFRDGNIIDSSSKVVISPRTIDGQTYGSVGGLVGEFRNGEIKNSYVTGRISGKNNVGGLVGWARDASLDSSYAFTEITSGDIRSGRFNGLVNDTGSIYFGGLTGLTNRTSIKNSFANVKMSGDIELAGGMVGARFDTEIENSYAAGEIDAIDAAGIIGIGRNLKLENIFSDISNSSEYSAGIASGLFGINNIKNTYWNKSTTEEGVGFQSESSSTYMQSSLGLTSQEMRESVNFEGFNFSENWTNYEGKTTPLLKSFMTPLTVAIKASDSQTYNADIAYRGVASIVDQANVLAKLQGTPNYVLTSKNAGTQAVIDNGLYSDQLGYLIKYDTSGSQVQIHKAPISVNGITADSKVYDGNQVASMNLSNMQASGIFAADQGTVALNISGTFDTKDVGDNKQVAITGTTGGANGGNYFIEGQSTTTSNITPATYTALNGSKTYDGGTALSNVQVTGVNGEIFGATGRANSKNTSRSLVNPARVLVEINLLQSQSFDINNYLPVDFNRLQENSVTIIPGELTYVADKVERQVNQPITNLTGKVTGFVQDDTLENSTQGELWWTTEATSETPEGNHAVVGQGLTSDNYDFVQSEANKTALTLKNAQPPRRPFGRRPIVPPAEANTEDAVVSESKAIQDIYTEIVDTFTASDAQRVNTELRMGDLQDGYWFFDCILNSGGQVKTLKCKPASQKKLPTTAFLK